jgi:hypothetical protein
MARFFYKRSLEWGGTGCMGTKVADDIEDLAAQRAIKSIEMHTKKWGGNTTRFTESME